VRARLGKDAQEAALRRADDLEGVGGRDVHEEDGAVEELRDGEDAVGCLALDDGRSGRAVVDRGEHAARGEVLGHPSNHVGVLGVDH